MIEFLCEMRNFWIWCASLLLLTGVLWAIPPTRRMPGCFMTGWKTVPAGCTLVLLVPVFGIRHPDRGGICRFLQIKYQAEFDWLGVIFAGMMVLVYSWIFLVVCDLSIIPPVHSR